MCRFVLEAKGFVISVRDWCRLINGGFAYRVLWRFMSRVCVYSCAPLVPRSSQSSMFFVLGRLISADAFRYRYLY